MPRLAPLLRGSLGSVRGPAGSLSVGSFVLPCRKLVLEYNETWPSSSGAKEYIEREAQQLAKRHPSVEFVVQEKPNRHPVARGFYVNNREKVISLRNMEPSLVSEKVRLLLESSGRKLTNLKRRPVEAGATESARGVWSQLHAAKKDL
ncbi:hypothetical protein FA10DRAFT_301479 [Acaromyces ingoldii]|uniref:Large ribosomal subunit protein mL43 n=1 Tax=Acaromyces ingoldii TaxID=215250 RepID=A0A316YR13_9BASI|nr:hypothetical protein FA10DRAFT_301479 [Acaromyces ingoldii]PWN90205.1 hypothetical protein FA10DRAFT_301479 [Acaromyces ingoldii]